MKSHKEEGLTFSLTNSVALNGNKSWLPHHSIGSPRQQGDAYPGDDRKAGLESVLLNRLKPLVKDHKLASTLLSSLKRDEARVFGDTQETVRSGNWYRNDTIWRVILDVYRISVYHAVQGTLASTPKRAAWSMAVGDSFAAVDFVCTRLRGFDSRKIPHLAHLFDPHPFPVADFSYDEIDVVSYRPEWNRPLRDIDASTVMRFRPHFGWRDHIAL